MTQESDSSFRSEVATRIAHPAKFKIRGAHGIFPIASLSTAFSLTTVEVFEKM